MLIGSSQLYFRDVQIPEGLSLNLGEGGLESISKDGTHANQYIVWAAETAQVKGEKNVFFLSTL